MRELPFWLVSARSQWRLYYLWHAIVHVGFGRYRYLCHYCTIRERGW